MPRQRDELKPMETRPCDWCDKIYYVTRKGRKHCTNKCAVYTCRERNRQKRKVLELR
jgi:hypothetical protein